MPLKPATAGWIYFVSFSIEGEPLRRSGFEKETTFDNDEVELPEEIREIQHIRLVEGHLSTKFSGKKVRVLNYIFLRAKEAYAVVPMRKMVDVTARQSVPASA